MKSPKHNHHNQASLLVKFVRRGEVLVKQREVFPVVRANFSKKEVLSIGMESDMYFTMTYEERKEFANRLSGK